MKITIAQQFVGLATEIISQPVFKDFIDPQYYPALTPEDPNTILLTLEGLSLVQSLCDSVPQNIAEPGAGYVSSHLFSQGNQPEEGHQILVTTLNDNGVGTNLLLQGTVGSWDEDLEIVSNLLNKGVWYWGDRAYHWHGSAPTYGDSITPGELQQLNEFLATCLGSYETSVCVPGAMFSAE